MRAPRVKKLAMKYHNRVTLFPNFSATGSITGMRNLYYGNEALLVRCGGWIYNVTRCPEIYYDLAN